MSDKIIINFKPDVLSWRRELVIEPGCLQLHNSSPFSEQPVKWLKEEIESFRFGVKWIRGTTFYFGRIYCVDIKNKNQQIIKIRLKTLYGINKEILNSKYAKIVGSLYECYFLPVIQNYCSLFASNKTFEISGITFHEYGLLLPNNMDILEWDDVSIKRYQNYLSIFSTKNPNHYLLFYYNVEWNVLVLEVVIDAILKSKGNQNVSIYN
ncbi:MAG: hypothetical protein ABI723_25490 [Bacteroidia bacterium]